MVKRVERLLSDTLGGDGVDRPGFVGGRLFV